MPTKKILTPLLPDSYFHIFNRGNDRENLFFTDANYQYFIKKYVELIVPFVETYSFCLIPNHFHFLVKVNESKEPDFHLRVSHQFRRLFQSYALAINEQEGRSGSLFRKTFRRIQVNNMDYLKRLVFYIHFNPQKHQLVQDYREYPYSSFHSFKNNEISSFISSRRVFEWFNDKEDFINYHNAMHDERKIKMLTIEDD